MTGFIALVWVLAAGQVMEGSRYGEQAVTPTLADSLAPEAATAAAPPLDPTVAGRSSVSNSPPTAGVASPWKPSTLIRSVAPPSQAELLPGERLTLAEVLDGATDRRGQTDRAIAYWALFAAEADYRLAQQEGLELATLRQSAPGAGAEWDLATEECRGRVAASRTEALAAQQRLRRLLGGDPAAPAVLPSDFPHCGRYDTRFSQVFGDRPNDAMAEAADLSELISQRGLQLQAAARDVGQAFQWLDQASQRQGAASGGVELLQAHQLWTLRRREFVAMAANYNQEIAEYAALAAPGPVGTDRLLAMLIRTEVPATAMSESKSASRRDPNVAPATFAEEAPLAYGGAQPDLTASGHGGESTSRFARRPVLRFLLEREHSILRGRPRGN